MQLLLQLAALRPMLHAVLGEGVIDPCAVDKGVEEVLHVPEGYADRILSGNNIINHKTHKTEQNHGFFHLIKSYFECKYRLFRKKYVTLQQNQTGKTMTEMRTTVFTPTQIHLLKMFQYMKTEEELIELKNLLFQYYSKKMDERLDELWDNGVLDQKRLDEINKMDLHQLN